jgi:hypothetical protein
MRVIVTDDLYRDPLQVLHGLCDWLAIDTDVVSSLDVEARHKITYARNTTLAIGLCDKRCNRQLLGKCPSLCEGLKNAYLRLNADHLTETLQPSTRSWLKRRMMIRPGTRQRRSLLKAMCMKDAAVGDRRRTWTSDC